MRALLHAESLGIAPPSNETAFAAAAAAAATFRVPSASGNPSCVCICSNRFSGSFLHRHRLRPLRSTKCLPAMTSSSSAAALHDDGVQLKSSTSTSPLPSFIINGGSTPFTPPPPASLLVFSGGTAFNGVVEELKKFTTRVAHVLPVSDDGGSTAEIVRVLGGPAVGDIRSRCLRLSDESTPEALAVKTLLGYRLSLSEDEAKAEWYEILEGRHVLWQGVSGPYRETIRAFLVHFQTQIFRHSASGFSFGNGSVGNFFFAGARIFLQSLEAAIFLYSRVCQCPTESLVLPAICTNDRLTIGSELSNGTIIRGQNEISHPPAVIHENAVSKVKHASTALPSPIKRIFYMSSERSSIPHEVYPIVNSVVLEQLGQVDSIVYAMGSLYTSICPSLILRGVGENIAKRRCPKILIINGSHDRETMGMAVSDFVVSVSNALNRKFSKDPEHLLQLQPRQYINVILIPKGGEIPVDRENLDALRINTVIEVDTLIEDSAGIIFQPRALINALQSIIQADFAN